MNPEAPGSYKIIYSAPLEVGTARDKYLSPAPAGSAVRRAPFGVSRFHPGLIWTIRCPRYWQRVLVSYPQTGTPDAAPGESRTVYDYCGMVSLLYLDKLDAERRQVTVVSAGLFLFAESLALLRLSPRYSVLAYLLGSTAMLILGIAFGRRTIAISGLRWSLLPVSDLATYAAVVLGTVSILPPSVQNNISPGRFLPRSHVEIFLLAVFILALAALFPATNDPGHATLFRPLEYLKFVPFGYRRSLTGVLVLILLGLITSVFLFATASLIIAAVIVMIYALLAVKLFQDSYGYRSYIMCCFCPTLFLAVAVSYVLQTKYNPDIAFPELSQAIVAVASPLAVGVFGAAWGVFFFLGVRLIWTASDLMFQQKFWHTLYLGTLGTGHLVIWIWWIYPFLK